MVLTKSDVRKYIFDLITLSFFRSTNSEEEEDDRDTSVTDIEKQTGIEQQD